jgi:acyl carrier protein
MNETNLINSLKKKFKHLKKRKININNDLSQELILDSLELMEFMLYLEKRKYLNFREYTKKHNDFKLSNILKYINDNKK